MTAARGAAGLPVLAIDVGGTKLAAALVDAEGRVSSTARVDTPAGPDADAETLWRALDALVGEVLGSAGRPPLAGVGVGCGGPMTWPAGEISPLNIPGWRAFPLRGRLQKAFPEVPVRLRNDAMCVAIGEHWRGAGRGSDNVLGMVVSTGVGGGLVIGGRMVDGASGNAGHIGHVVVEPQGPECVCGGRGCLEAVARGPAVVAWASEHGWVGQVGAGGRELVEDARRGHEIALAALERAGSALGLAIASTTHLLDLEVVAIGGGLTQAGPLLLDPLEETFRAHAAALGQQAGLVGAAALVHEGDRYWSAD
jgi:glucokinase